MEEILLGIGELASICNVTPKTLRHYDRLGLLKPAMINKQNGYRFYKKTHITRVIAIKQLQEIGVSLEQIRIFYGTNQSSEIVGGLNEILIDKEREISLKLEDFSRKLDRIHLMQRQCSNIQEHLLDTNNDTLIVKDLPDRNIIYKKFSGKYNPDVFREYYRLIWDSIISSGQDIENICSPPLAVFNSDSRSENVTIQIGYQINTIICLEGIDNKIINAGKYACDVYQGAHSDLKKDFYKNFYENINKSNYVMAGEPIEIYYISEIHAENNDNYCTEIQIPIQ